MAISRIFYWADVYARRYYRRLWIYIGRLVHREFPKNAKDVESGPHASGNVDELNTGEYFRLIIYVLAIGLTMYVLPNAIHYMWYGEMHPGATDPGRLLEHSSLLHSIVSHLGTKEETDTTIVAPYREYSARSFNDIDEIPEVVKQPCRDITKAELLAGLLLENYEIPLLLMHMCEVVHDLVGCDESGYIIPKLLKTPDDLNVCIVTYKEASGVCSHFINPVGRPVLEPGRPLTGGDMASIVYVDPVYKYRGEQTIDLYTKYKVAYQPIVEEQVTRDENGDIAIPELSESYKQVERAYVTGWLSTVPKRTTVTLQRPDVFYYQLAEAILYGSEEGIPEYK